MDFHVSNDAITLRDEKGQTVAEVDFPAMENNMVNICHTYVSPSLRGQKVADRLLLALVEKLRAEGKKAYPTCSYAVRWFSQHPEHSDLCSESRC
ncbi:GNAT family N-acetyltransferase [Papillibacter cinnamivorans]|uniref:N-acetyltransferase domain-containing protein n=1 Tax=Papillibacter cinnamivorans DSM 12816 TaxID=1122930 RepID=A0A1W2CK42_9FIRM|nr:GNAT family N-acetyltransferase [Papillibacter cinnamivorans]SMC85607.1 hypothetical protein SAMN02745168_0042 [Papillibacter cinnamivorans DSM 12816]